MRFVFFFKGWEGIETGEGSAPGGGILNFVPPRLHLPHFSASTLEFLSVFLNIIDCVTDPILRY